MAVFRTIATFFVLLVTTGSATSADIVVEDGGVSLSRQELAFIVKLWSPDMQRSAAMDPGDRLELINMALVNKKMAQELENIDPATVADQDAYWRYMLTRRNGDRKLVVDQFLAGLPAPDVEKLAQERYQTQKNKYALVAEQRKVSHILLQCLPGRCDRVPVREQARELLQKLQAGTEFDSLAQEFNQDPATRETGGRIDAWLSLGMAGRDPHFVGGAFEPEKPGEFAVAESRYGLHVIRLDEIKPEHYLPFEKVKEKIVSDLQKEYVELATKEFNARFNMSPEVAIDQKALDEIFAPYVEAPPAKPAEE